MTALTVFRITNILLFFTLCIYSPLAFMLMVDMYMTMFNIAFYSTLNLYMDLILFLNKLLANY